MESLHYLLMKSHSIMHRRVFEQAQKIGLTLGQPKILDYLREHEGENQKTIAEYCEIEPATLGSILLRMENKGYIERRQKNGNRRSLYVYLTDKGKQKAEEMNRIFIDADSKAELNLTDAEVKELKRMLLKICTNLESEDV